MENSTTFLNVPERPSFPDEEEKTLLYWRDIKAFPEAFLWTCVAELTRSSLPAPNTMRAVYDADSTCITELPK
eukprot:3979952-Amphidinium_carterae.1